MTQFCTVILPRGCHFLRRYDHLMLAPCYYRQSDGHCQCQLSSRSVKVFIWLRVNLRRILQWPAQRSVASRAANAPSRILKFYNLGEGLYWLVGRGLLTASPSGQNFVCLVRSRLQCHVRRHCLAKIKGKFGSYAFLHTTPSDYIRSHCTSFLTFIVLNKMNLSLLKLFSFTFMWES